MKLIIFIAITNFAFASIKIKVIEPINFKNIKKIQIDGNKVIAKGYLELTSDREGDNITEDYGKLVKINFPKTSLITNKNNWLTVENISLNEIEENGVIFKKNGQKVEIRAIIDKSKIDSLDENIEGEYIGDLPLEIKVYEKIREEVK